jgi:hypothetical protein
MASKAEEGFAFQGIPEAVYTDYGPIAKTRIFGRVPDCLGVRLMTHVPQVRTDGRWRAAKASSVPSATVKA